MKEFYKVCRNVSVSEVRCLRRICSVSPSRFGGILGVVFLNF